MLVMKELMKVSLEGAEDVLLFAEIVLSNRRKKSEAEKVAPAAKQQRRLSLISSKEVIL